MTDSAASCARYRATVEYDGTAFHGSQLQPGVRTVQREFERALSKVLDGPAQIDFAGRTDTGVHATAQEAAFTTPRPWDVTELARALDATLPRDAGVRKVRKAPPSFHPRFDARARRYRYLIGEGPEKRPLLRDRCWIPGWPLDRGALAELADALPGERSFVRFARAGQPQRGTRCRVASAGWQVGPAPLLCFEIVADRFLHRMVRYLVGTSVEIAAGRRPAEDLRRLLAGEEGSRAVFPVPPGGLYLAGVRYDDGWNVEAGHPVPWLE